MWCECEPSGQAREIPISSYYKSWVRDTSLCIDQRVQFSTNDEVGRNVTIAQHTFKYSFVSITKMPRVNE